MRSWMRVLPFLMLWASGVGGAELHVSVHDAQGQPVADAVISLDRDGFSGNVSAVAQTHVIDQRDETFIPYVQTFRTHDRVVFLNSDRTRHHVYSFSPLKPFETVLSPGESSEPLSLDKPGIIAVGCNIHDRMIAYLHVSDAWRVETTSERGVAAFAALPMETLRVSVWHPRLLSEGVALAREVALGPEPATVDFEIRLAPDPRHRKDRERSVY
ncbi:MAG: hypothetical protein KDJ14_16915 [Xanthomonadales bacterium]|nr:hypothetical protein [Xanthomonadales bacterium]